jgi:glucose-1-phosphate thymidylyltransferase
VAKAGVSHCFVVIADWKTEIVRYLGDGGLWGVSLAYLHRAEARGLADAIDAAHSWIDDAYVCLALPDTVFTPDTAVASLRDELLRRQADLCLAVFPTTIPQHLGPVRYEPDGRIVEVLEKPTDTRLFNTWGAAVWSPRVSRLLHRRVTAHGAPGELILADVFNDAIREGMPAYAVPFSNGSFTDVGRPSGLQSLLLKSNPAPA